jgi:hypothetical protein
VQGLHAESLSSNLIRGCEAEGRASKRAGHLLLAIPNGLFEFLRERIFCASRVGARSEDVRIPLIPEN